MAKLFDLVPAVLTGGGSDEWVVGPRTFQSQGSAGEPIFENDPGAQYRVIDNQWFIQTAGNTDWLRLLLNAGAVGSAEAWVMLGRITNGSQVTKVFSSNNAGSGNRGTDFGIVNAAGNPRFQTGLPGGSPDFLVVSSLVVSSLVVPLLQLVHLGFAWKQEGANGTVKLFVNGVIEETTAAYAGQSGSSSNEPAMFVGPSDLNHFFDGVFYKGAVYDHFLTDEQIAACFDTPPETFETGCPPAELSGVEPSRASFRSFSPFLR